MRSLVVLFLAIFAVGLGLRWACLDSHDGRSFAPGPDAMEYAALAHDLADRGDFALQVGEQRARSRYPPGWPMLLSIAVRCGLRGEDLLRVPALISCLCACAMAVITWLIWSSLFDPHGHRPRHGVVAASIVGMGWTLTPMSLDSGRVLMSDEVSALFSNLGLTLLAIALLQSCRRVALLLATGALLMMAVAIRPVNAYIGFGPVTCLLLAAVSQIGWRAVLPRTGLVMLGALPVALLVFAVLAGAGFDPFA